MSPRAPFLTATDYVFYLRRQVDKEQAESNEDEGGKENFYSSAIDMPRLSDLLHKLSDDLKTGPQGFVEDFENEANNGISWLLDILRASLNRQQCPGMVFSNSTAAGNTSSGRKHLKTRDRQHLLKRAMTDEYDCLVCLRQAALRDPLLTSVCAVEPDGAAKVLEAMSTMRIVFGESVRFKLLVSIINSASLTGFEAHALRFINELLGKSPSVAERVRLQCELEEAGLNVTLLEKKLLDKDLPPEDSFWTELKQWNDAYVDVVEAFKRKRAMAREMAKLKEGIELLQRALTKLEEDKISLMQIERELKEKCDDYEVEMGSLRSRLAGTQNASSSPGGHQEPSGKLGKSPTSSGSDHSDPVSGMADSGRWSDSDAAACLLESAGLHKHALMVTGQAGHRDQDAYDTMQKNRNEDILIYIPAIKPPANFATGHKAAEPTTSTSSSSLGVGKVANKKSGGIGNVEASAVSTNSKRQGEQGETSSSRWRFRQRNMSSEELNSASEPKPTVIEVYPKKAQSVSALNSNGVYGGKSTNLIGANDSDDEQMLFDWNYPSVGQEATLRTRSERLHMAMKTSQQQQQQQQQTMVVGKHCHTSLGQLHQAIGSDVDDDFGEDLIEADNSQFLLRSRDSFLDKSAKPRSLTHSSSLSQSLSEMSSNSNHSNNGNGYNSPKGNGANGGKPKNLASSIQSYFFSGTVSKNSKSLRSGSDAHSATNSSNKAFPMPSLYKKGGFIRKGHGNCGLYSRSVDMEDDNENENAMTVADPSSLAQNMNKLVHREIALAAKDLGAWL